MTKRCKYCQREVDFDEFPDDIKARGGKNSYCYGCKREIEKARYNRNKEKRLNQMKKWKEKNRDKWAAYQKSYKAKNKTNEKQIN